MKTEAINKKRVSKMNLVLIFLSSGLLSFYFVRTFIFDKSVSIGIFLVGIVLFFRSTIPFIRARFKK